MHRLTQLLTLSSRCTCSHNSSLIIVRFTKSWLNSTVPWHSQQLVLAKLLWEREREREGGRETWKQHKYSHAPLSRVQFQYSCWHSCLGHCIYGNDRLGHLYTQQTMRLMSDWETETERETDRQNLNLKTLFYKDCSLGSVKNLTTNPC